MINFSKPLATALITSVLLGLLIAPIPFANAQLFEKRKQGKTFETKGLALIYTSGALTVGIERDNIPIARYIDANNDSNFNELTHDSEFGWTKCRVPLKSELSWQGVKERSLVFDCKPLTYF